MRCPDDEQLVRYAQNSLIGAAQRELSSHVRACEDCRLILSELGRAGGSAPSSGQEDRPAGEGGVGLALEPGAVVGRYVVLKPIGRGGMGVVALAYDPELDRRVALKLLRGDLWRAAGDESMRRLRREAQAMAKLTHPNVVTVYDVGELGDQVFVAMEFVDGTTLRSWLRAGPRSLSETLSICLQAGRGLAAVHAAGLIHRDVKPENIMVRKDGRALVTDFGLARRPSGEDPPGDLVQGTGEYAVESDQRSQLTRTGVVVGTPAYMAPEQHLGKPVDARTDQFGFCATVYEALYKHTPFEGKTHAELADAIVHGRFASLPGKDRRVPTSVRRALARGLRADPRERYASMSELLADLEQSWLAKRASPLIAAGVILSLGLGALGIQRASSGPPALCRAAPAKLGGVWDPERREAVRRAFVASGRPHGEDTWRRAAALLDSRTAAFQAMYTDTCEATHVRGEQSAELLDLRMQCLDRRLGETRALTELLASASGGEVVDKAVTAILELPPIARCADAAALRARVPLPNDAGIRSQIAAQRARLDEARALTQAGRYGEAAPIAAEVRDKAAALGYPPLEAEALYLAGSIERSLADYKAAEGTLIAAAKAASRARDDETAAQAWLLLATTVGYNEQQPQTGLEWVEVAEAAVARAGGELLRAKLLYTRGRIVFRRGQYSEAQKLFEQALGIYDGAREPNHPDLPLVLGALGKAALEQGAYAEARAHFERVLSLRASVLGPDHPDVAESLNDLALLEEKQGNDGEARKLLERSLAIHRRALGPDHPAVVGNLVNLGLLLLNGGAYEEAQKRTEEAIAILQKTMGPDYPGLVRLFINLAASLIRQGKLTEAWSACEDALRIGEKALGPDHPDVADVHVSEGAILQLQGKMDEARGRYESALTIIEKALGPEHPNAAEALENIGITYSEQQRYAEAHKHLERALAIRERAFGPNHRIVAATLGNLGDVIEAEGDLPRAIAHQQRALAIAEAALGQQHPELGSYLTSLARCFLAQGKPNEALPLSERAVSVRGANKGSPEELADSRFVLAKALHGEGRDRERAVKIAGEARAGYAAVGASADRKRRDVDAWLRAKGSRIPAGGLP